MESNKLKDLCYWLETLERSSVYSLAVQRNRSFITLANSSGIWVDNLEKSARWRISSEIILVIYHEPFHHKG